MSGFIGVIAGTAEQQKTPAVVPATMHAMQTHNTAYCSSNITFTLCTS